MGVAGWVWFAAAAVLVVAELVTLTLAFAMVAAACAVAGTVALLGASVPVQVAAAAGAAVAGLVLVRPVVTRQFSAGRTVPTGAAALAGTRAIATAPLSLDGGQVRIDGVLWRARLAYPALGEAELGPGSEVTVGSVDGATVIVYPPE